MHFSYAEWEISCITVLSCVFSGTSQMGRVGIITVESKSELSGSTYFKKQGALTTFLPLCHWF